jgi:serine/threonine protein kinase
MSWPRELGGGRMATVYLAEDLRHRRKVAVKVLRPELAATLGAERFAREIEIAAQLQHPIMQFLPDSSILCRTVRECQLRLLADSHPGR